MNKNSIFFSLLVIIFISIMTPKMTIAHTNSINNMINGGIIQSVNITGTEINSSTSGSVPAIVIGDGKISSIWNQVTPHPITSLGPNGYIKSVYGKSAIYFLLVQDPTYFWIACQWDSNNATFANVGPMDAGDDLWIFGNTPQSHVYGDAYSIGQGFLPVMDTINNLQFERVMINDSQGNPVSIDWEVSHPYLSNDTAGHDIQFISKSIPYTVLFASNIYHLTADKITESQFVFSNLKLGQAESSSTSINTNPILIDRFIYTQIEYGLIVAIIALVVTLYIPIILKIVRKN